MKVMRSKSVAVTVSGVAEMSWNCRWIDKRSIIIWKLPLRFLLAPPSCRLHSFVYKESLERERFAYCCFLNKGKLYMKNTKWWRYLKRRMMRIRRSTPTISFSLCLATLHSFPVSNVVSLLVLGAFRANY